MSTDPYKDDIDAVLITEEQIRQRTRELAESVAATPTPRTICC